MTRIMQKMYAAGEPISVIDAEYMSPHGTYGVKRLGNYHLDLKKAPEPWLKEAQFREAAKRTEAVMAENKGALKPGEAVSVMRAIRLQLPMDS